MIKNLLNELGTINEKVMKAINIGLLISLFIGIVGLLLVLTYITYSVSYDFYGGGFILIKTGLAFAAQILCCGLGINKIIKEKI